MFPLNMAQLNVMNGAHFSATKSKGLIIVRFSSSHVKTNIVSFQVTPSAKTLFSRSVSSQ